MRSDAERCVTFDLWETLIFDDPESDQARGQMRSEGLQRVLADHGTNLVVDDVMRAYEASAPLIQSVWDRNDEVSIMDQIRLIVKIAAKREVSTDATCARLLEEAYVDPTLSIPPKLNRDALNALQAVSDRGYKVGLISNTGRSPGSVLRKLLDRYRILSFFDATVFSNEVNRRKPDRIIFDAAAQLLGAENKSIVHVGDNAVADFWGARNADFHALLLDQPSPESARWGPNSLFALARANGGSGPEVEPRWRIGSLTETADRAGEFFAA